MKNANLIRSYYEKTPIEEIPLRLEESLSTLDGRLSILEGNLSIIKGNLSIIKGNLSIIEDKLESVQRSLNKFFNVHDAALYLGVSKSQMIKLFDDKEITHIRLDGNYYVKLSDIDFWIMTGITKLSGWFKDGEREVLELNNLKNQSI